jgi:Phytanoyl-CoA dioxygenase (PhyH)
VLTDAEIAAFTADGYVAVRQAVPAGIVRACQDDVWAALAERGVRRGDPATWPDPVVRVNCPDSAAFTAAGTRPALWEAYDQLIGEGRWLRRQGVGGTIPVRFPSPRDPGDAGWHIEASYSGPDGGLRVNRRSRARGLLSLFLLTDVVAGSAPTRLRPGSHRDAARVLAAAGDDGLPWLEAAQAAAAASQHRPVALATGQAGDVFICHPFLVHAASWPHAGAEPRMIAQPGIALHDAYPLVPPLSPAEQAMTEAG